MCIFKRNFCLWQKASVGAQDDIGRRGVPDRKNFVKVRWGNSSISELLGREGPSPHGKVSDLTPTLQPLFSRTVLWRIPSEWLWLVWSCRLFWQCWLRPGSAMRGHRWKWKKCDWNWLEWMADSYWTDSGCNPHCNHCQRGSEMRGDPSLCGSFAKYTRNTFLKHSGNTFWRSKRIGEGHKGTLNDTLGPTHRQPT